MKELPILFSGPMVQALLNTKPGVWPPEPIDPGKPWKWQTRRIVKPQPDGRHRRVDFEYGFLKESSRIGGCRSIERKTKCPYSPGTRLYVRETWVEMYGAYFYRADADENVVALMDPHGATWRPSIFMPKAAARLWLEVKSVTVERVQDITEEDARAEGVAYFNPCATDVGQNAFDALAARAKFISLWDSLNAKRGHGWDQNDWVWVYELMRLQ